MTGATGSLSKKKRRESKKTIQKGAAGGRALRLSFHVSPPWSFRKSLRPPQPWPNAEHGAPTSSFLFLKESPMAPQMSGKPPV